MPINQVEPPQAHEILKSSPDAIYLDVRTEPEFALGHPDGAINVPVVFIKGPGQMELNGEFVDVVAKTLPREKEAGGRMPCGWALAASVRTAGGGWLHRPHQCARRLWRRARRLGPGRGRGMA